MAAITTERLLTDVRTLGIESRETSDPVAVAFLVSEAGTGSSLKAVIDAIKDGGLKEVRVGFVLSDSENAGGYRIAEENDIKCDVLPYRRGYREYHSATMGRRLNQEGIELAVMAGWRIILSEDYFTHFNGATINIHPGIIPNYPAAPVIKCH